MVVIQEAVEFASKVHKDQTRKGKDVPYITHPRTVAEILSRVTDDENIIAAGLLHDTIEDCQPYGSVTKEFLTEKFNADVARIVSDVSEQDKTLPWMERKMATIAHLKDMPHDSLLVKTADVLQNLSEVTEDIRTGGQSVFLRFNASKENTIAKYNMMEAELARVWPENPLLPALQEQLKEFLSVCYT